LKKNSDPNNYHSSLPGRGANRTLQFTAVQVGFNNPFTHQYASPANPSRGHDSFSFLRPRLQNAGPSYLYALGNAPMKDTLRRFVIMTKQAGQRTILAACRRVLRRSIQRSEHPRSDVELVGAVRVNMDIGRHAFSHE
jgi:hypothetical protein